MKTVTLDKIVRNALASRNYPMHWYLQFLHYGANALRELNFDVLQNVKSVTLSISANHSATLPCDFVDYIRIGNPAGQYIYPFGERRDSYNRMPKYDSSGMPISYGDVEVQNGLLPSNWEGFWYTNYINDKGEHLGRIFNNYPTFRDSFVVLRERNEIQFDVSYTFNTIVMDYITNGMTTDSSNAIHPYAQSAIEAYIFWKMKEHSRKYNMNEAELSKQEYYNQLRILRARMNSIDINDIKRSLSSGYGPVIKN